VWLWQRKRKEVDPIKWSPPWVALGQTAMPQRQKGPGEELCQIVGDGGRRVLHVVTGRSQGGPRRQFFTISFDASSAGEEIWVALFPAGEARAGTENDLFRLRAYLDFAVVAAAAGAVSTTPSQQETWIVPLHVKRSTCCATLCQTPCHFMPNSSQRYQWFSQTLCLLMPSPTKPGARQ